MEVTAGAALPAAPNECVVLSVSDASQVGEARRVVAAAARRLGLDATRAGRLAIIATEAAGNLLKHATVGELLLSQLAGGSRAALEIVALDRGPGIADVGRALRDGYSTTGTPGTGLGAIRRLSDEFDLYSSRARGTAVLSRVYLGGPPASPALQAGAICVPKPREEVSGDAWAVQDRPRGARVLVADGLGHGPEAHRAARVAVATFQGETGGPAAVVEACHLALRSTRGAALAVAEVDVAEGRVRFAGVGNVTGAIVGGGRRQNMVSVNGTAGQGTLKVRELEYTWWPGSLLVMASDGLGTRWSLEEYAGLAARHPALVAGVLYRDHARGRDDVTVVAVREQPEAMAAAP
jgi:anti-sigma regulatory factor (Ser/Thr protein kinase)